MKVKNDLRGEPHERGHKDQYFPGYSLADEGPSFYGGSDFVFPLKDTLLDSRIPKGGQRKTSFVTRKLSNGRLSPGATFLDFYFVRIMVF